MSTQNLPSKVVVMPPEPFPSPPYANSTAILKGEEDIAILFMRTQFVSVQQVEKLIKAGTKSVTGEIVASIVLPPAIARNLGERLVALVPKRTP